MGEDGPPTLTVDDSVLAYVRVDQQLRLRFGRTEVIIESVFSLSAHGEDYTLDPDRRSELVPVLDLYPDTLREISVSSTGTLRLDFESGSQLSVLPNPSYEAWQVSGPGTRLVVCAPGGTLAVWS